jgi:hypothetical protein
MRCAACRASPIRARPRCAQSCPGALEIFGARHGVQVARSREWGTRLRVWANPTLATNSPTSPLLTSRRNFRAPSALHRYSVTSTRQRRSRWHDPGIAPARSSRSSPSPPAAPPSPPRRQVLPLAQPPPDCPGYISNSGRAEDCSTSRHTRDAAPTRQRYAGDRDDRPGRHCPGTATAEDHLRGRGGRIRHHHRPQHRHRSRPPARRLQLGRDRRVRRARPVQRTAGMVHQGYLLPAAGTHPPARCGGTHHRLVRVAA